MSKLSFYADLIVEGESLISRMTFEEAVTLKEAFRSRGFGLDIEISVCGTGENKSFDFIARNPFHYKIMEKTK